MAEKPSERRQGIGGTIFALAVVFCSMEMSRGWGIFNPGWPPEVFYGIVCVAGAVSGPLMAKYRVAGVIGGAVAGAGALLFATTYVLEHVQMIHKIVLILAGGVGSLPGIATYYLVSIPFRYQSASPDQDDRFGFGPQ